MGPTTADLAEQIDQAVEVQKELTETNLGSWTDKQATEFFRELDARIWVKNPAYYPGNRRSHRPRHEVEDSISYEEWKTIEVLGRRFPSIAHNQWCHFGFGMTLLEFPVAPGAKCEYLCTVNTDHLGKQLLARLAQERGFKDPNQQAAFHLGWELFSPITHADQNREWLELYKLSPARRKVYYDY